MRRAWRATSRLRTGSSPGGATLSTMRSPSAGPPVTRPVNVRLDAPPVSGCTSEIEHPGAQVCAAAVARRASSSRSSSSAIGAFCRSGREARNAAIGPEPVACGRESAVGTRAARDHSRSEERHHGRAHMQPRFTPGRQFARRAVRRSWRGTARCPTCGSAIDTLEAQGVDGDHLTIVAPAGRPARGDGPPARRFPVPLAHDAGPRGRRARRRARRRRWSAPH